MSSQDTEIQQVPSGSIRQIPEKRNLNSTTSNTERLLASIQQDKEGKITIKKLDIEESKTPRKKTAKKKVRG